MNDGRSRRRSARPRLVPDRVEANLAIAPDCMIRSVDASTRERLRRLVDAATRARLRGERAGFCAGCGCLWDERTPTCPRCQTRHWYRRFNARNGHVGIAPRCKGCGAPWEERTSGCRACYRRELRRRHRAAKRSWDGGLNPSPAARTLAKLVRGVADNVVDRLSRSARSRWHRRRALTTDERSSDARLRLRLGLFALRGSFSRTELAERIRTHVQEPTWVVMERERASRFATPACRALAATAGTRGTPSPPSGSPQ
jgi:hypothetical protein